MLFNLDHDPGEQEDLAAVHPDPFECMLAALEVWRADFGAVP